MNEYELMITIFSETTYKKNKEFCQKEGIKCLYSSSFPITPQIPKKKGLFVLEADNTNNQICGIGFVKNITKTRTIYNDDELQKYNGYVYVGKKHIFKTDFENENNKDFILLFKLLEQLCFYGKTHLKRLNGIQRFPNKWLNNLKDYANYNLVEKIIELFKQKRILSCLDNK
jgi:hypothetical protein